MYNALIPDFLAHFTVKTKGREKVRTRSAAYRKTMPRKKQLTVEKSNELTTAVFINFDVSMLRLLEIFLSKINPRDPNNQTVTLTKAEFCELAGLHPKSKSDTLVNAVHKLQKEIIVFSYETEKRRGIRSAVMFSMSDIYQDKDTGAVMIMLKSNPDLEWLFFNLGRHGYIKYALLDIIKMKHKASFLLHSLFCMKLAIYKKPAAVMRFSVPYIRRAIGVEGETYEEFKNIRKKLDEAVEEINMYSSLNVELRVIKNGKKVIAVEFTVKKKDENETNDIPVIEITEELGTQSSHQLIEDKLQSDDEGDDITDHEDDDEELTLFSMLEELPDTFEM